MHDYALETADLRVEATMSSTAGLLEPGALQSFALRIPLESFTTDKDGLKKRMLETIKAEKHPVIAFTLGRYTVNDSAVRAHGALTVAGVTRDVALDLDVADTPEGIRVRGRRDLSMKEFGIKAPTMFLGMLKTSDMVTIAFDLLLTPAARVSN